MAEKLAKTAEDLHEELAQIRADIRARQLSANEGNVMVNTINADVRIAKHQMEQGKWLGDKTPIAFLKVTA